MKKYCKLGLLTLKMIAVTAQEPTGLPRTIEQQIEDQAEHQENITEDDSYWQQLHYRQKHPLNLNAATEDDMKEIMLLSDVQVSNFLQYRALLGSLIDIYELQAIPSWDLQTIHRLLPFVTVTDETGAVESLRNRLKRGEQKLLLRMSTVPERSRGYAKTGDSSTYLGSPLAVLFRYTYRYKNLLQYGVAGDKDAGEQFFRGKRSTGFDFYAAHFFVRKLGIIKQLALGDFTVQIGQGLIQWQGMSFKKSTNVSSIKKQAPVLKPYLSAGEFNFYRGVGITLQANKFELTLFGSVRKFSANLKSDSSLYPESYISSLISSGYHRSLSELADRNNVQCVSGGGAVQWRTAKMHLGLNTVQHYFSQPFHPRPELYDLFAMHGSAYRNYSFDYGYTVRNMHLFGEVAVDKDLNTAQLHGLLAAIDPKIDLSVLYRVISSKYQSLFSNAFTENSSPVNETGCYAGIAIRPAYGFRIDAYADVFSFPWLKYQVNSPSQGQEYMLQLTCTPNKQVEIYTRLRHEIKPAKAIEPSMAIAAVATIPRTNWRSQITWTFNRRLLLRSRVEAVWYDKKGQPLHATGFLFFQELHMKPSLAHWSLNGRLQYVETDGYNARIYAMENLVLYNYSMPAFFDKGLRYIINIGYRFRNRAPGQQFNCQFTLAFAQTVYPSKTTIGSGYDTIEGRKRSDIKLQMIVVRR